jgi:murein DD-endopeptidase MepM/ murein hydrolase activator NlpD
MRRRCPNEPAPELASSTDRDLETSARRIGLQAVHWISAHRRAAAAAVVLLFGGFAVTAFGIAPAAPDPARLPSRVVVEAVAAEPLEPQLEALAGLELPLLRDDLTRATDTPATLLARLGVDDAAAVAFLRSDATARELLVGRAGKMVQARTGRGGRLAELVARYPAARADEAKTHFRRLTVTREGERFAIGIESVPFGARVRLAGGTIRSSLFAAADEAGVPDAVAAQVAEIFSADVDFRRELKKGDTFSIVYETLTADGEPVVWNEGIGRVLAAEFVNEGRAYDAVWYGDSQGRGGYFALDGTSKRRSFLASPMEFSRVTSGFAMRFHPIQQTWRRHLGVDYGAPTGTAVRVVGDGLVQYAGWQTGYGNVVIVEHGNDRSTVYAHLSRIDVRKGERVQQGETVGAVGMTGWATGPHLHFEFRVRGEQQDPLRVAKNSETFTLAAAERERFVRATEGLETQIRVAASLADTRGAFE